MNDTSKTKRLHLDAKWSPNDENTIALDAIYWWYCPHLKPERCAHVPERPGLNVPRAFVLMCHSGIVKCSRECAHWDQMAKIMASMVI